MLLLPFSTLPYQVAGMLADNVTAQGFYEKIDIWPRNEASKENVKSLGQYLTDTCEFTSAPTQSIEPIICNS